MHTHVEAAAPGARMWDVPLVALAAAVGVAALVVLPRSVAVDVALPPKTLVVLAGVALTLGWALARTRTSARASAARLGLAGACLAALVALALVRLGAATDPGLAEDRVLGLVALFGAFLVARLHATDEPSHRASASRALALLALAGTLVALVGLATLGPLRGALPSVDAGASTFATRNLAAGFAALALPLAWPHGWRQIGRHGWRGPLLAALACATIGAYVALSGNRLALLAAAVAVALLAARELPRLRPRVRALACAGALALAVLLAARMPALGSTTAVERLHLWATSAQLVADRPLAGHGTGQWSVVYPQASLASAGELVRADRLRTTPDGFVTVRGFRQPLHAHQDALELASELGAPAALLFLVALGLGAAGALRSDATLAGGATLAGDARLAGSVRARAGAACAAFAVTSLASFPLAEPASAATLGLCLALAAPAAARASERRARFAFAPRTAALATCGLATCALAIWGTASAATALAAQPHFRAALAHTAREEHAAAAGALELARALDPRDARWALHLSYTYAAAGETGAAIAAARETIARRPWQPNAWNNLGLALRREGRLVDAEVALRTAHALLPGDAHVNVNLGSLLVLGGRPHEARPCFERAVSENPNVFQAWEGLADCALLQDDLLAAVTYLEQAREARLRCAIAARSRET